MKLEAFFVAAAIAMAGISAAQAAVPTDQTQTTFAHEGNVRRIHSAWVADLTEIFNNKPVEARSWSLRTFGCRSENYCSDKPDFTGILTASARGMPAVAALFSNDGVYVPYTLASTFTVPGSQARAGLGGAAFWALGRRNGDKSAV